MPSKHNFSKKTMETLIVDYFTFCHSKDVHRLYENVENHVNSHGYQFNKVNIIHQRIPAGGLQINYSNFTAYLHEIRDEHIDEILKRWGINHDDKEAEQYTHGSSGPHFYKYHCVNHLKGLEESKADYIVFSDSDCYIKSQPENDNN